MTPAELCLWAALRRRQLDGVKFRAQHAIGRVIADFYCPAARLIIEVDGPCHAERVPYDQARSHDLEAQGYRVLRIPNEQVLSHLPQVLSQIRAALEERQSQQKGAPSSNASSHDGDS